MTFTLEGGDARPPDKASENNDNNYHYTGKDIGSYAGYQAGAGIYVPTNSTLIITGEGTLVAKGGNAADGMHGFKGWDQPWINRTYARSGGGGRGGFGGGGAGAAIGGYGGKGGKAGDMWDSNNAKYPDKNNFENWTEGNNNRDGNPAGSGETGASMGKVYILGKVKVNVYGGVAGKKGGAAGDDTGWVKDDCLGEYKDDWIAGPGGGGGGGGAGCGVAFAIGGGAGGGGGGGGGATGSFVVSDDWDDSDYGYGAFSNLVVGGNGGYGGKGPANTAGVNGENGKRSGVKAVNKKSGDYGHDVNCKDGGAGGVAGENGKNGSLFVSSTATITCCVTNQEAFQSFTVASKGYEVIQYDLTFVITGDRVETYKQTLGCSLPGNVPIPTRTGYKFLGYFSGRNGSGEKYYSSDCECLIEGVWSKCEGLTLYASWALANQVDNHILVKSGEVVEYDGLVDKNFLTQPSKGNLFEVQRGGKLILRNVNVYGSDIGRDSVIKNFGEAIVSNCVFKENFSPFGHGAVYRDRPGAKALFYGCTFKGNSALEGGVIATEGSEVTVVHSSFFENYTTIESPGTENSLGKVLVEGSTMIAYNNAKLNCISCTFYSNRCNNATWQGTGAVALINTKGVAHNFYNNLVSGCEYIDDAPNVRTHVFIRGENFDRTKNNNNLFKMDAGEILGDEIERDVDNAIHFARRPLAPARSGGISDTIYHNDDWTKFATASSGNTPNLIVADQFGQHPIAGWFGAVTGNTLQYLINNASSGDTLMVPPGRYDPVEVNKFITIVGEKRDSTYINGDLLEPCLLIKSGGEDVVIKNFSFLYGKGKDGGGISAPETGGGYITNCVFVSCAAENGGAVAYLNTASQCVFTNCVATVSGGGTYKCELVDRSYYIACVATEKGGGGSEDKMIRASLLSSNTAKSGGGGYKTKFYNCTFDRNQATAAEACQGTAFSSWLVGCVLYGNQLPTDTSLDSVTYDNIRATAEYKSDKFYNAPLDFHLRLKNFDASNNKRTPVDHSLISVGDLDSNTMLMAENEKWLDIEGNPLVSSHMLTGEKFLYGGCYAFAPYKISGTKVTGADEWYDNTNAKTSLREAIEAALTDPAYMTNKTVVITFSDDLIPEEGQSQVILTFGESQIDVSEFTNRTLVIQGPTNRVIAINGNNEFRAFRVMPENNLRVENLLFQNCLGSEYGTSPQPSAHGGAILNYGNLVVSNCVFAANTTGARKGYDGITRLIGYGGAIAAMSATTNQVHTEIYNSSFKWNKAQRGGAIYLDKNTRTDVFFSTFGENEAHGAGATEAAGGAIATDTSTTNAILTIVNSTLVGNSVPDKPNAGGAIVTRSGLVLLDSIVLGNTSGGTTNDLVMTGGTYAKPATARIISSAVGTRTKESGAVNYSNVMAYDVEDMETFISTTNAVSTETVLPHIIYPVSSSLELPALGFKYANGELFGYDAPISYKVTTNKVITVHEEEETVITTNYVFRVAAIRGSVTKLAREGRSFQCDQTGEPLTDAIFGATVRMSNPRINTNTESETEEEDTPNPEDPEVKVLAYIVDYMGKTNNYASVEAAITDYKYGDTIISLDTEDETLDKLFEAMFENLWDKAESCDWFDFYTDEEYTTYGLTLNDKAKPEAGELEVEYSPTEVAMRTLGNMKLGLWYALGYSESIEGPYLTGNWQEAKGPNAFGEMYFDKPLTAPKIGDSGFYRVIVAPYCPSGEEKR